jgi:hypothetical protein
MGKKVTFIGRFRIDDADAWLSAIARMADFVESHVPRVESFHAYASADGSAGTVVYVHPDADSFDQHLAAAAEMIAEGSAMVDVTGIELLGSPDAGTIERLRAAGTPVDVKRLVVGFTR